MGEQVRAVRHFYDEETGVYYYRFRYYAPQLGQYTQQAPVRLGASNFTFYAYVENPIFQIDELGLSVSDWLKRWNVPMLDGIKRAHGHLM